MFNFKSAFSLLQKIGKCMMLPVSVLPIAGILLGVGSANFSWLPESVSLVMAKSGDAIFGNLPLLFAIGVAIGLTENDGVSALAGTVGYVVFLAAFGILLPTMVAQLVSRAGAFGNRPAPPAPRARSLAYWLACLLALTALLLHLLILQAHRASPPRLSTPGIVGLLGSLLAAMVGWGIAWRRAAGRT